MQVTISLGSCYDCRHVGHSGAFTVRGARVICDHGDACQIRMSKTAFRKEYPEYRGEVYDGWEDHWIHRVLDKSSGKKIEKIPEWCPLKHGSKY